MERFQLALMLAHIAFRNFIEVTGSTFDFTEGSILPKSFNWVQGRNVVWTIFSVRPSSPLVPRLTRASP